MIKKMKNAFISIFIILILSSCGYNTFNYFFPANDVEQRIKGFTELQDIEIITLTDNIPLPFKIDYNKGQVGSDRLVAVASAMREKPNQNCLVIDIGTCITYDIITSDNIYHGGPISPGINLRFRAMNEYTEKLPLIENYQQATINKQYENIICNSTKECLVSGIVFSSQLFFANTSKEASYIEAKTLATPASSPSPSP